MVRKELDNLGLRQRALNLRVNDAVTNEVPFHSVKNAVENSEVDKLFKIDLAANVKNVDYLIEILKSGDSFYTTRALKKASWLFSDEHSHIMCPEYLHSHIFPFTSMKRKILKTAAAHITNPERAAFFYHYLIREKMLNTAFTCLLYTTEGFKLDQLKNNKESYFKELQNKEILYIRFFIGKSFVLLDAFLSFLENQWKVTNLLRDFKNFYLISNEQYLDMLEKFVEIEPNFEAQKFDLTISKNIMKKHKQRVLSKITFYVNNIVDTDVLVRNSSINEAKMYVETLLPKNVSDFWAVNQYDRYSPIFRIIPNEETVVFFKNYFTCNFPNSDFEMHPDFYRHKYYRLMTVEEREEWAYRHIKSEKQILGVGCDYLWYRFINFETAFTEVKNYISVTKNADKRNNMAEVLIKSARNNRDLETLFKYYSKRHMKEFRKYRDIFMKKVISNHNVFDFDNDCWTEFYMLLLGMDLYNKLNEDDHISRDNNVIYKTVALVYHVLNEKDIPEELMVYFLDDFNVCNVEDYLSKINKEKQQQLHEYFFTFYMNKINEYKYKELTYELESRCIRYYDNVEHSIELFNEDKTKEECEGHVNHRKTRVISPDFSERALLRDLKENKKLVIDRVHNAKRALEVSSHKMNTFLNKIKIYFPNDVATIYLDMFQQLILNRDLDLGYVYRSKRDVVIAVRTGVNAIMQLGDETDKLQLMTKYVPSNTKEKRTDIDIQQVRIQRAICWHACTARPPVPLHNMLMYIKGDYAKHCLHVFNTYLAHLPLPKCQEFVHLVIDAPVSIQKHGIRLAFQCFDTDKLEAIMLRLWNETRNVSLRSIIYKAFYNKVKDTKKKDFYELLKIFTLDLHENDEDEIFGLTTSEENALSEDFLGDYIEVVWETVTKFKDKEPNITRKKEVLICMCNNIQLMREDFVSKVVNIHISTVIDENKLRVPSSKDIAALNMYKWLLVAHYILHFTITGNLLKDYVKLAQLIFKVNIENWDVIFNGKCIYQQGCWIFFKDLTKVSLEEKSGHIEHTMPVFEGILQIVDMDHHEDYDKYFLKWEIDLMLIIQNVMKNHRRNFKESNQLNAALESVKDYGVKVGELVSNYVQSETYFMSFSSKYKEKIHTYYDHLLRILDREMDEKGWIWEKTNVNMVIMNLAVGLVEVNLGETGLLAIQFMPAKSDSSYSGLYECLINKLQQSHFKEVQLSLYKKIGKAKVGLTSMPKV